MPNFCWKQGALLCVLVMGFFASTGTAQGHPFSLPQKYATGQLAGHRFSGLYTWYTGIPATVRDPRTGKNVPYLIPDTISIDFAKQLDDMCRYKVQHSSSEPKVVKTCNRLSHNYRISPVTRLTLQDQLRNDQALIDQLNTGISWVIIGRLYGLNPDQISTVRRLTRLLDARVFQAYSETERLPSYNGWFNAVFDDFLLRSAGLEFINGTQAMYDNLPSYGRFQFTQMPFRFVHRYDVKRDKHGRVVKDKHGRPVYLHHHLRGLMHAAQGLPPLLRPHDKVTELDGNDHFIAAWLLAVDNIAEIVRHSTAQEYQVLVSLNPGVLRPFITGFTATGHNAPGAALEAAQRFLDNRGKYPYEVSCHPRWQPYAIKTRLNYEALLPYFNRPPRN